MKIYDKDFLPIENYINGYNNTNECMIIDITHPKIIDHLKSCGFIYYDIKEIFISYIIADNDFSCLFRYSNYKFRQLTHVLCISNEEKQKLLGTLKK